MRTRSQKANNNQSSESTTSREEYNTTKKECSESIKSMHCLCIVKIARRDHIKDMQ